MVDLKRYQDSVWTTVITKSVTLTIPTPIPEINSTKLGSGGSFILCMTTAGLYLSTDFGSSWTQSLPDGDDEVEWDKGVCSGTGTYIIAERKSDGVLYRSGNTGSTWATITPAGAESFTVNDIKMSESGQYVVIVGTNGTTQANSCYTSADYGVTWTVRNPTTSYTLSWTTCDISDDGQIIMVGATGDLYVTFDGGVLWKKQNPPATDYWWESAGISGDGKVGVIVNTGTTNEWFKNSGWNLLKTVTTTPFTSTGRSIVGAANAAAANTVLGLGTTDSPSFAGLTLTGTDLAVSSGGTGASTFTDGGLLVGAAAGPIEALAAGTTIQILVGGGSGTNPAWGTDLPTAVTIGTKYVYRAEGTDIPIVDGGTGLSTLTTAYGLLAAGITATGTVQTLAAGGTTQIIVGGGASALPAWGTDLPTAITIGSAYIYRAAGTDVPVMDGGTGLSAFAVGDIVHATAATTLAGLPDVAVGSYLRSGGVVTAPLWSTLILPNAATAFRLPVATSANTIGELAAVGATGEYLKGNTGAIPSWATLNQAAVAGLTTADSPTFAGLTITAAPPKITMNAVQVLYLPDQTPFPGSLVLGNGGLNLSHVTDVDGYYNTILGLGSGTALTTGSYNTAIGYGAMPVTTIGYANYACGVSSLLLNTEGYDNVAIGNATLLANTTGSGNTAVGTAAAASKAAMTFCTFIGRSAASSADSITNSTAIGSSATVSKSNQVVIGNTSVTETLLRGTVIAGVTKLGDGGTTNYLGVDASGRLTLYGAARVMDEIEVFPSALGRGSTKPDEVNVGNFSGLSYDIGDDSIFQVEVPSDWDSSSALTMYIYWYINEAYATGSGEIQWRARWSACPTDGSELVTGPTHTGTIDFGDQNIHATANRLVKSNAGTIAAASLTAHDMIGLTLDRVALDGGSNPTADPVILRVEFTYISNKLGDAT